MELIEGIPYGIVSCFLNGRQVTVLALSDSRFAVRVAETREIREIKLSFLHFDKAEWETISLSSFRLVSVSEEHIGKRVTFETGDAAFKKCARSVLKTLTDYVRLKSENDDDLLVASLTDCPVEAETAACLSGQKRIWFSGPFAGTVPGEREFCLSIDRPESYERFLKLDIEDFQTDFLKRNFLSDCPLFQKKAERVYIGSAHCRHLFPENVDKLILRAREQGLHVTAVLPPIRESAAGFLENIMTDILKSDADEIVINDLGTLLKYQNCGKRLLLGTYLNRRRKDPRIRYKLGFQKGAELMRENNLNDVDWASELKALGITRFEYESCGMIQIYPKEHVSLHLPFYLTNGSHGCLIAASCEGTDPGLGRDGEVCPAYCQNRARLYPDTLRLTGRYNALFGVDTEILTNETYQERALCGVDCIVAELL